MKINIGHGHVRPLPGGAKVRCGGPAICPICAEELRQSDNTPVKISKVVSAINNLIFAKMQSDTSLISKEADEAWIIASGERWQRASVELMKVLEGYIETAVQKEFGK